MQKTHRWFFLIATVLLSQSGMLQAQTYTLQPGATVWNATSVNWLNQNGQPVAYANATSVNPVINGPVAVTLQVPRIGGNLTLNNGVTLTASPGAFLQILQGSAIVGAGPSTTTSTINSTVIPFLDSGPLSLKGALRFNGAINFGTVPVAVAQGSTTLGGGATLNASVLDVGRATEQTGTVAILKGVAGAVVNTGDFTVTSPLNGFGIVDTTETVFNIAGTLRVAEASKGDFLADGGSINVGGVMRLANAGIAGYPLPVARVSMRNLTLTIADNGGPALDGEVFTGGGGIGVRPSVQFPGTRIRVRPGGFLTFAGGNMGFGVNNTIVDTTGGDAVIHSRLWGKALIKEGPGILKLTRDNYNGGGGGGVLDGTIVRGGFIEFATSLNLNDGGFLNQAANNDPPIGLKNIQLNGGGLRWAPGSSEDISSRLRLLNNFSFDLNGNDVTFATPLAGTGGMTKHGAGTLTLTPGNTYAGGTTVKGGFVQFSSLATLGSGNVTLDGGGLRWAPGNTVDVTSRLQPLGAGGGIVDTLANNVSFAAPVTGTGALTKLGTGTLTLNGTQPWTGGLFVSGGSVTVPGVSTGKAQIVVGAAPSSVATMAVSGASARLASTDYLEVGSRGNGTLNITGGGQVTSGTTTALAVYPGSFGEVNITGGSSLTAGTTLFVGYEGPAVMTVGTGSVVTVGEQLRLGVLPGGSGAFVLAPGGTLNVGGADGIRTGTGEGGFYLNGGTLKVTGSSLTTTVPMTLNNSTLIDTSGVNGVFGGALSGQGGFVKTGGGILYLNAPGSYAGGSALYGGSIVVPAANALGTGPISILGGSLQSTGTFSRDVPVTVDGASASLSAAGFMEIGVGGTGSLAVQNGAQVSTPSSLAFAVLPGGTSGFASVVGAGSSLSVGTTMLIGYSGSGGVSVGAGGTITSGAQMLLGSESTGAGFFTLNPGGTLNIGGSNGIAKGNGAGTFNFSGGLLKVTGSDLTTSVPMTLTNVSLVDTSGVTATLSGALSGAGGLAKTGAGSLTLAAANSYSGATQVIAGTLAVNQPTLADGADVALGTGTTLHLAFTGTDTIRRFTINGLLQATGTWGAIGSGATHQTALITGPGLLNVSSIGAAAFTITNPANTSGTVGQPYSGTFTQSGAFGAVTWSLTPNAPGALTPGLSLSSGGVLSGIPTQAGTFNFSVRVTDANGFFTDAGCTLTFSHPVITVNNPATTNGRTNVPFNQTFTSTGGNGASTFTIASGSLPSGLALTANGTLSGTPTQVGTFPITVTATDIYGGAATGAAYALTIQQASNNANLSALGVSAGELAPAFASATTSYQIFVGPDVTLLYVVPTAVDPLATITVNGNFTTNGGDSPGILLAMGANPISIVVTSSDFTAQKTYTLIATRTGGLVLNGGGLTLLEEGGSFRPGNIAPSGTAFAKDVLPGYAAHSIAHLNDATFGNGNSWIANSARSFAGVSLGATPVRINEFAFGRDNQGVFPDRSLTRYTLQFTTVANPTAATPDASWTTIGTLDYFSAGGTKFAAPALRHRYSFTPVTATGLRLIAVEPGTGIDEIEIYSQLGIVLNGGGLALLSEGGTFAPDNLARSATATPFADGVIVGFPAHSIAHLNDGQYGNDFSWVNDIPAPFAGIALGASRRVNQIAFGRDNTGAFSGDRTFGVFTLQYTNVANPSAATPAASWNTIGTLDYQFAGGLNFATPSRRHVFSFNPVTATALRLVGSTGNNAIDELEIYRQLPQLIVEQPAGVPLTHNTGSVNFGNLQPGDTNTKTFTLTNAGNTPLNLDTLFLTGTHLTQFTLTPPVSNTLAQGESTTFTATFAPSTEGPLTALLHIPSNDPDIADFLVPLAGVSGQPPVISGYANQTNFAYDSQGLVFFYPAATATDDSGLPPTLSYSHPSGSLFPIGVTTVTITATDNFKNSATATFTITIAPSKNPLPVPVGGSVPQNIARGKVAFAKDVVPVAPHTIARVNDGLYGNANSWIADALDSFVGINLGATPIALDRVAFGRDHTGVQTTRSDGIYTLQYTTVPNPDASTPDASWQSIAAITYPGNVVNPNLRHLYGFPSVFATGFRLKTLAPVFGIGIDELELYGPTIPNNPPSISDIGAQSTNEDTATGAIAFTIGDVETAVGALTLSGTSSNTTLVPNANVVFGGSGANRTVTVTPVADLSGSATITVSVTDGNADTSSDTFLLTVNAVNDVPSFAIGPNRSHPVGTSTAQSFNDGATAINDGDPDTKQSLTFNVSNNNNALFTIQPSIAANGALTYTPNGTAGTATVSVTLTDDATAGGAALTTSAQTFTITVNANTAPTISDVVNQTINEDGNSGALAFTIGDAETPVVSLSLSGSSSNTTLVPNANIVFGGSGANRTVTVTPVANGSGTATITLTVSDGLTNSSDAFVLTVNAVNDAPTLSVGTVATHPAGRTGMQTQAGFATVDFGPPDEDASQAVADFLIDTVSDPSGILVTNALDIANNGTLSYTLTGVGGTATITTRVRDNGGTANAGVDTSAAVQFSISVTPGADLQISKTNNRNILVNGQQTLYAIVVANAGPNAVTGANLIDILPATLINASWMCVAADSTATCPSPGAGTSNLNVLVNLGVNQFLRFDLLAEVNGAAGAFVTNTAIVRTPAGTTALNTSNDSATDQDPIDPDGIFANGFENGSTVLTVPMAKEALEKD